MVLFAGMKKVFGLVLVVFSFLALVGVQAETAVSGYDVVAYQTEDRAVRGDARFSAVHGGKTYLFASVKHKEIFVAEPARYEPAYGGYCAYGVAQGVKVPVDPHAFAVVNGTLYLNVNQNVQRLWARDARGYIATADRKWARIK